MNGVQLTKMIIKNQRTKFIQKKYFRRTNKQNLQFLKKEERKGVTFNKIQQETNTQRTKKKGQFDETKQNVRGSTEITYRKITKTSRSESSQSNPST